MEHWEEYRPAETGREMMARVREEIRAKRESTPGTPLTAREPMQPWPPVPTSPPAAPIPAAAGSGVHVLRVPCPACKAAVGLACFIPSHPNLRPHGGTHPSRRTAALHDPQ
jgi:hypothetical protein